MFLKQLFSATILQPKTLLLILVCCSINSVTFGQKVASVEISFAPNVRTFSNDGKWMVVSDQFNLGLIDLESMELVAEKRFDIMVRMGMSDGRNVVMVPLAEDRLYQLDRQDLSIKKSRFLPGKLLSSAPGVDGRLVISVETGFGSEEVYAVDSGTLKLEKLVAGAIVKQQIVHRNLAAFPRPDHQFSTSHFDLDGSSGKIVGLRLSPPGFETWPEKIRLPNASNGMMRSGNYFFQPLWGRSIMWGNPKNFLLDAVGNRLTGIDGYLVVSPDYPVLIGYKGTHYHDNRSQLNREAKGIVSFRSLIDGTELSQTVAYTKTISQRVYSMSTMSYSSKVDLFDKNVFVNEDRTIYKVPIPQEAIKSQQVPFHLVRPKIVTVDLSRKSQIPIKHRGKVAKLQFELEYAVPHVSIDARTGTVTIDGPGIWDSMVRNTRYSPFPGTNEHFKDRLKTDSMNFLDLDESVAPVSIPICIKATADGSNWDQMTFFVVGKGMQSQLDEKIAKQKKERDDAMAKARKQQDSAIQNAAASDEKRVEELEARMLKLEELLQSVEQKLKQATRKGGK